MNQKTRKQRRNTIRRRRHNNKRRQRKTKVKGGGTGKQTRLGAPPKQTRRGPPPKQQKATGLNWRLNEQGNIKVGHHQDLPMPQPMYSASQYRKMNQKKRDLAAKIAEEDKKAEKNRKEQLAISKKKEEALERHYRLYPGNRGRTYIGSTPGVRIA